MSAAPPAVPSNAAASANLNASANVTTAGKNTPHLRSVASSLRSCLDGMLPDAFRNDAAAFHQHLIQHKPRLQSEKNSWRFGLNYQFETLKQHKDWYARNQQFVQFRKDRKRLETHVAKLRGLLAESVSTLDLEVGLRGAQLEGRVGAYKIMFEVTKIVTKLSRPHVKLQILKPSDAALSIYCDAFVLDMVLAGGAGAVESASLTTVEKDVSKEFPERNADLLEALKQLAAGESSNFTDKLVRLINRAELAVKYPNVSFEQAEDQVYNRLVEATMAHPCWTVSRVVDGIGLKFKDPSHCAAVIEPPSKKAKLEDTSSSMEDPSAATTADSGASDENTNSNEDSPLNQLLEGEWTGSISFIEWRGQVCLHVVGNTPLVMVGNQAHLLAVAALQLPRNANTPTVAAEEEKLFSDFVGWAAHSGDAESVQQPISPQLRFAHDHSISYVAPPSQPRPMRQNFTLVNKEISGGLKIRAFPIPLVLASSDRLAKILELCGHNLLFHSVFLSVFGAENMFFGHRPTTESSDTLHVPIAVDASAPDRLALKTGAVADLTQPLLIELNVKADCTIATSVKMLANPNKPEGNDVLDSALHPFLGMEAFSAACHSVPMLTFFIVERVMQLERGNTAATTDIHAPATSSEPIDGLVALDDGISVPVHLEGEDMLLEDIGMF